MPLNARRLSAVLVLLLLFVIGVFAQTPTSADVMRSRISKAKAFVAVKNFAAAIFELESIKRETNDPTVVSVVQVMLMGCYLEQLDYKRAQALLNENFNAQKTSRPGSNYFVVAGQVVKSARNQMERYKSLGLSVSDRNLPTEAIADVEKMRETVEMVVSHSKTLGENKKLIADSMALIEEATVARSGLARDEYDSKRWKEELADARDKMTNSRTTIINTVDDGLPPTIDASKTVANANAPIITMIPEPSQPKIIPVSGITNSNSVSKVETQKQSAQTEQKIKQELLKSEPQNVAKNEVFENKVIEVPQNEVTKVSGVAQDVVERPRITEPNNEISKNEVTALVQPKIIENSTPTQVVENFVKDNSPIQVGSLIDYATAKVAPTYPAAAKSMRMTGTVKVEVLINEDGSIAEVQKTSGPSMLQRAAADALKKWRFKPFVRDGQPVKATGFVSFNFNL